MKLFSLFFILLLLLLPGCSRVIDWGKSNFYQGIDLGEETVIVEAKKYVRSVFVYNQIDSEVRFSALWLSDTVLQAYAQLKSRRYGMCNYDQILYEEYKKYTGKIAFYALSLRSFPLGKSDSVWVTFLTVGGMVVPPLNIKKIELTSEYKLLFGKHLTSFRVAYLVTFDSSSVAHWAYKNMKITMHFRSINKEALLVWNELNSSPSRHSKNRHKKRLGLDAI